MRCLARMEARWRMFKTERKVRRWGPPCHLSPDELMWIYQDDILIAIAIGLRDLDEYQRSLPFEYGPVHDMTNDARAYLLELKTNFEDIRTQA